MSLLIAIGIVAVVFVLGYAGLAAYICWLFKDWDETEY